MKASMLALGALHRSVLVLLALLVASSPVSAYEGDPASVAFSEVTEEIWLAYRPESTRQPVVGNGVVIVNEDHVVVIDGSASPLFADRVIEGIRARTDLPVRYLVTTHWHGDHNLGNHRYVEAFPGVEIIGHRFTRQAMLGAPMDYVEQSKSTLGDNLKQVAELLEKNAMPSGEPIPAHTRKAWEDLVAHSGLIVSEIQASQVTPPWLLFERELRLEHGGREIVIRNFGNGNTQGDAVVWLPAERILITGDVVVWPTPYGFGSYPGSWAEVIGELIALEPATIIPGHGPAMGNTNYLEKLKSLFEWVHHEVAARIDAGMDLEAIQADLDFSGQSAAFTDGDPWLESRFTVWFAKPIVEAAYNEIKGIENEPLVEEPAEE